MRNGTAATRARGNQATGWRTRFDGVRGTAVGRHQAMRATTSGRAPGTDGAVLSTSWDGRADNFDVSVLHNFLVSDRANVAARAARIADVHLFDGSAARSGDARGSDALIDDRVIVAADDVVHHGRVVIDLARLMMRHAIAVVAVMAEIAVGYKREAIPRQAERET